MSTEQPLLSAQDTAVILDIQSSNLSLLEVWKAYQLVHCKESLSLDQGIDRHLDHLARLGRTPMYVRQMKYVLDDYRRHAGDHLTLSQHTTILVESWLNATTNDETKRLRLRSFFSWAVQSGFCSVNPVPKAVKSKAAPDVHVLSNRDCRALIEACPVELKGHLFLGLGLGLRVAEAAKVEHLRIDLEQRVVVVGAKASKTRTRRVVEWPAEWDGWARHVGPIKSLRERMDALREAAGLKRWGRNCMRHTAASHWLNRLQDENKAALRMGHSPAMLHRHYKAMVTPRQTEEWFGLWAKEGRAPEGTRRP